MQAANLVPANEFCIHHNIEYSFINALRDYGLIEVATVEQDLYIPGTQLARLEKLVRMHFDLNINFEGLEAIEHLLERVERTQNQVVFLKNRLRLYENETP